MNIFYIWWKLNKRNRSGGWTLQEHGEKVVINNGETAKSIYKQFENELMTWNANKNYMGVVKLCEGRIHDNGEIGSSGHVIMMNEFKN